MKKKWRPTMYLAQPMTDCDVKKARKTAWKIAKIFRKRGIRTVSPVLQEKIPKNKKYSANPTIIKTEWELDKYPRLDMCHGIYVVPGNVFSNGAMQERGITRWLRWRKTYSYVPKKQYFFSITTIEEDGICHSHEAAAKRIKRDIGTRRKWIRFKLRHVFIDSPIHWYGQIKSIWL